MLLTYEEMSERAFEFYDYLQINIPKKYVALAVRSLTMPQYAKEYQDKYNQYIGDHRALATVGDAVCEAFVMLKEYNDALTSDDLDKKKESLQNEELNLAGEKILKGVLFAKNNDLESKSEKKIKRLTQRLLRRLLVLSLCWIKIKIQKTQIEFSKNTY